MTPSTPSKDLPPSRVSPGRLFIHSQFRTTPQYPPKGTDLSGKTAIVSGSNVGLGLECCKQLLDLQLTELVMAVRSVDRGEVVAKDLRARYPGARIHVWPLDMLSYDSVQAFAQRTQGLERLDMAVLNAGIASNNFRINKATGHEEIILVNYLSTVLLATLLLPITKVKKLPNGEPPVVTIVNSGLALIAGFRNHNATPLLPSFNERANYNPSDTYSTSKAIGHLWLWHAAEYVSPDDVVLSMVDPGYVRGTNLQRDQPAFMRPLVALLSMAGRTVQVGASAYVDAVVSKGKESHGCFLMDWEIAPFTKMLHTPEGRKIADRLWAETMEELSFANVEGILKGMKGKA